MRTGRIVTFVFVAAILNLTAAAQAPYTQRENVVYAEAHGVGLLMDIFTPTGGKNGLGIVDVISGAWHSDRGKIRDHTRARTFHILCHKGYTVFAIRPGSVTKFGALEMLANLNQGIRWVKDHADEYGIDRDRLGLMGASAGGHLACLAAVTAEPEKPRSLFAAKVASTRVKAVGVFFPPTDFLNYGGKAVDAQIETRLGGLLRQLAFPRGVAEVSTEELARRLTQISPAAIGYTTSAAVFAHPRRRRHGGSAAAVGGDA